MCPAIASALRAEIIFIYQGQMSKANFTKVWPL